MKENINEINEQFPCKKCKDKNCPFYEEEAEECVYEVLVLLHNQ